MVSRDGWVVYDDTQNFILDENDWWVPANNSGPEPRTCNAGLANTDAASPTRAANYPDGAVATSAGDCCNKCFAESDCTSWVYEAPASKRAAAPGDVPGANCWPLADAGGSVQATDRTLGIVQVSSCRLRVLSVPFTSSDHSALPVLLL